jgi:hypothetical protein
MASQSINNTVVPSQAKVFIISYAILITFVLVVGGAIGAKILSFLFPVLSVALAIYLYRNAPLQYISFVWWMIFLAPLIRRLIDFNIGNFTFGPWTLTSSLVSLICGEKLFRNFPRLMFKQNGLPFILCTIPILYGTLLSVVHGAENKVIGNNFLAWISPIAFGYFIQSNWQLYPALNQILRKTFLWGCLIMGVYGVAQYLFAPAWDGFWLFKLMGADSPFGRPEPFGIRVFSTMNSPQTFATVMMAGLLLVFGENKNSLVMPTIISGMLAFLLSTARTAWLSIAIGLPALFLSVRPKIQIRLLAIAFFAIVLLSYAISSEELNEVINNRLQTFISLGNDESFQARSSGYQQLISVAITYFIGTGFDFSVPIETDLVIGDGSILPMLFSFGWLGTIPYLIGIYLLLHQLFQGEGERWTSMRNVSRSVALGIIAQIGLNPMFVENIGLCLWCFMSLGVASNLFHQQVQQTAADSDYRQHLV